jgi:hypothetical protein
MHGRCSSFVALLALLPLAACGGHLDGDGSGGSNVGGSVTAGSNVGGSVTAGSDAGGSATGGATGGSSNPQEYPPSLGYEHQSVTGCDPIEHPGRSVLTLFDDPAQPFIPQRVSGDGQVAAGVMGELTGRWRKDTGFIPYDPDFRGNVDQLDCAGEYAGLYDEVNRAWLYMPDHGMFTFGIAPSYLLPMKLPPAGGRLIINYIDRELNELQPHVFVDFEARRIDELHNTVLYNIDDDGYALGVDALRVFYNALDSQTGFELARVKDTGPLPRVVVNGNGNVVAISYANGGVLWGPVRNADPRRPRMVIGAGVPLALSSGGRVLLFEGTGPQIWIEETYFTAGGGYRDLNELATAFGADLQGERLYATDMSQDAQAFVGYTEREGRRIGFHLTLPREAYPVY